MAARAKRLKKINIYDASLTSDDEEIQDILGGNI